CSVSAKRPKTIAGRRARTAIFATPPNTQTGLDLRRYEDKRERARPASGQQRRRIEGSRFESTDPAEIANSLCVRDPARRSSRTKRIGEPSGKRLATHRTGQSPTIGGRPRSG